MVKAKVFVAAIRIEMSETAAAAAEMSKLQRKPVVGIDLEGFGAAAESEEAVSAVGRPFVVAAETTCCEYAEQLVLLASSSSLLIVAVVAYC